MCPQYLWIDTPHPILLTTLIFGPTMAIFKFSYPMYRGSNVIVHQFQNFCWLLHIKLHLKMPGNEQLQISPPPYKRSWWCSPPSPFTILVVHWRSSGCPLSPCLLRTSLIASVPKTSFSLARLWFHFQYKWYASSILVFPSLLRLSELTQIAWVDLDCLSWLRLFCVD